MALVRRFLGDDSIPLGPLELATTPEEEAAADDVLAQAGLESRALNAAILNPGGNNPAKRWPPEPSTLTRSFWCSTPTLVSALV